MAGGLSIGSMRTPPDEEMEHRAFVNLELAVRSFVKSMAGSRAISDLEAALRYLDKSRA